MNGDDGYKYRWSRTPLSLGVVANSVTVKCTVSYWIEFCHLVGNWRMPLGTLEGTLPVTFQTALFWTPEWKIASNTQLVGSLPDIARNRLAGYAVQIDNYISQNGSNVTRWANDSWKRASIPNKIFDNPQVWFSVMPRLAYATPIGGSGSMIGTSIGLLANPRVDVGNPPSYSVKPIPPLHVRPSSSGQIFINLQAELKYSEANKELEKIKGLKITSSGHLYPKPNPNQDIYQAIAAAGRENAKISAPGYIIIDEATISGGGNMALVTLKVSGFPFWGTIYFIGKLNYDPVTYLLSVEQLSFKTASSDVFFLVADWVLHGPLLARLQTACQWNVADQIDLAQERLEAGAASAFSNYKVTISGIKPLQVYSTSNAFDVAVQISGSIVQKGRHLSMAGIGNSER